MWASILPNHFKLCNISTLYKDPCLYGFHGRKFVHLLPKLSGVHACFPLLCHNAAVEKVAPKLFGI